MSGEATVGPRDREVALADGALHVWERGPIGGPPVVLLHGFLSSARAWDAVAPALAADHRVIIVDLPGCGASPDPGRGRWSVDRAVALLDDLVTELDVGPLTLVGTQMGGSLAACYAAAHPERLARLVVMAAGLLGETTTNLRLYRLLASPVLGRRVAPRFPADAFAERWAAAHGPGFRGDEELVAAFHDQLLRRGHAMARFGLAVRRSYGEDFAAYRGPLRDLAVPTLLIWGADDPLVPLSTAHRFQELLSRAHLIVLPGCGDFPHEERPEEVAEAIASFAARPARESA